MVIGKAKTRFMRAETGRDTDEIRVTYDLPWVRHNITLHVYGDSQIPHLHLFFDGAYEVHAGQLEALLDDSWHTLNMYDYMVAPAGRVYNARVPPKPADALPLQYPNAGPNVGAVSFFAKNLHEGLDVARNELDVLLKADWFPESFLQNPDKEANVLKKKLSEPEYLQFVDLIKENRSALKRILPEKTYSAMDSAF
ncbi:MAG: hypothetical protein HYT16_01395 [DPANN group archaeon]|nr:hypothetical protein [DPANN group archaeon]